MKQTVSRFLKCCDGSSAVEFAILALPMFLLLLGSVEAGRAYWTSQAVKDVATSVARCIGVARPECAPDGTYDTAAAVSYGTAAARGFGVLLDPGSIVIDENGECAGVRGFAIVTVSYRFSSPIELIFPDEIIMIGSSCYPVTRV
ncbi:TadE/TadG family type IV pilus assembly protein [Aquamicrobium segne]|uniref:TadE/TadG family type IV pilus assembly protein n=1 Tax=Aquamicrobium segne TaxID=469547 RepID=A0ABW0GSJ5_9HYPH